MNHPVSYGMIWNCKVFPWYKFRQFLVWFENISRLIFQIYISIRNYLMLIFKLRFSPHGRPQPKNGPPRLFLRERHRIIFNLKTILSQHDQQLIPFWHFPRFQNRKNQNRILWRVLGLNSVKWYYFFQS